MIITFKNGLKLENVALNAENLQLLYNIDKTENSEKSNERMRDAVLNYLNIEKEWTPFEQINAVFKDHSAEKVMFTLHGLLSEGAVFIMGDDYKITTTSIRNLKQFNEKQLKPMNEFEADGIRDLFISNPRNKYTVLDICGLLGFEEDRMKVFIEDLVNDGFIGSTGIKDGKSYFRYDRIVVETVTGFKPDTALLRQYKVEDNTHMWSPMAMEEAEATIHTHLKMSPGALHDAATLAIECEINDVIAPLTKLINKGLVSRSTGTPDQTTYYQYHGDVDA